MSTKRHRKENHPFLLRDLFMVGVKNLVMDSSNTQTSKDINLTNDTLVAGVKAATSVTVSETSELAETHQIAEFIGTDNKIIVESKYAIDELRNNANYVDNNLANFLSRPVRIARLTWTENTPFANNLFPWELFLTNVAVKNKLEHYQLLRCNLHVSFMINGTPFHMGRLMACYTPFGYTYVEQPTTALPRSIMLSQRPKVFIDPMTNATSQLDLPFFFNKNWMNLTPYGNNFINMGVLQLVSLNDLQKVSTTASTELNISVFAWATEVELTMPTTQTVAQSDEYGKKIVSQTASTVARIAHGLSSVPIIGTLARATEIGASAVAGIASLFGFSKPNIVTDTIFMKQKPDGIIASTMGGDTSQKLTFDLKQETTIDPKISGFDPGVDELTVGNIAGRESLITTLLWASTDAADTELGWCDVNPINARSDRSLTTKHAFAASSTTFASLPFKNWTGALVYRVQLVASDFHRGRIRISYEPNGAAFNASSFNTAYSHVIDLDTTRDFEFVINWAQDVSYKNVSDFLVPNSSLPPLLTHGYQQTESNGTIYFSVLNELTSPDTTIDVSINIYIKAGHDFELMNPVGGEVTDNNGWDRIGFQYDTTINPITPPAFAAANISKPSKISIRNSISAIDEEDDEYLLTNAQSDELATDPNAPPIQIILVGDMIKDVRGARELIHNGDPILSFRPLMKRFSLYSYSVQAFNWGTTNSYIFKFIRSMYPARAGYWIEKTVTPQPVISPLDYNRNLLCSYLAQGFMGVRGGMRFKILSENNRFTAKKMSAARYSGTEMVYPNDYEQTVALVFTNATTFIEGTYGDSVLTSAFAGVALTDGTIAGAIEFEIPYYSKYRFQVRAHKDIANNNTIGEFEKDDCGVLNYQFAGKGTIGQLMSGTITSNNDHSSWSLYGGTSEDYNLIWYIGCPILVAIVTV